MSSDPSRVIVTETSCNACGANRIEVYHQHISELRTRGTSAEEAAERLATQLESSLDAVNDLSKRELGQRAVADIRAFLNREGAPHFAREI